MDERAKRCWELMDRSERFGIRFGMFPVWISQKDLGGKVEGYAEINTADDSRFLAVALMAITRA